MREESAVVAGAAVRYWRREPDGTTGDGAAGDGVAILLHGIGSDHSGLSELAATVTDRTVVVPDLPGFGASAPLPGLHSLGGYAGFVDALRRHLGAPRVAVVGHSLGATVALVHAGLYPGTVDGLVLFNPVTTTTGFAGLVSRAYYAVGAGLPAPLDRMWLASRGAVWVADEFVLRTHDRARRRAILDQDYRAYRRADLRAVKESLRSFYDTDFAGLARQVATAALVVTGDRDRLAPPSTVRRLHRLMPDARLVVVDGAGHLFPAEQPRAAGALLDGFLIDRQPSAVDNAETAL